MFKLSRVLYACSALAWFNAALASAQTTNAAVSFGSVAVGASSSSTNLTFTVPSGALFTLSYGSDFALAPANCAGGTCSVPVTFQPTYPGVRKGAVSAFSGGVLVAVTPLVGIGTGAPSVGPGLVNTVVSRQTPQLATASLFGITARGANQLYVADSANHQIFFIDPRTGQTVLIAGNGTAGFSGDGGPATAAQLNQPSGLAIDLSGNLLIADTNNNRIRKVDLTTNVITTIAGTGTVSFTGDGGPAINATFYSPSGLAVSSNGDIVISDTLNSRIRVISASNGVINTIAGSGVAGFSGDGGAAGSAQLNAPVGVALDSSDNVYIADVLNNVVREVSGGVISTVAGQGGQSGNTGDGGPATSALLNFPYGVKVDAVGNLIICDARNNRIREVGAGSHTISTLAGTGGAGYTGDGGAAAAAQLNAPTSVSIDDLGNVYFIDSGNIALRRLTFPLASASNGLYFIPVSPCRIIDTRLATGPFGGPLLAGGAVRNVQIENSPNCAGTIPGGTDVQAYALNVTVVPRGSLNFLTVAPSITSVPNFSTLNARDGRTKANAAIVPANLTDPNRSVDVYATSDTDLILDITGYYVPQATSGALAYFPLAPCRATDTRAGGNPGGNMMGAGETRNFAMVGVCNLPSTAQAYALNFTAIPQGAIPGNGTPLPWLTAWPAGSGPQPVVSTLNATTGAVTANAAIIPAGAGGEISVFAKAATDVVIDVSGYYAPVSSGSGGLALHNTTPCRAYDSRFVNTQFGNAAAVNGTLSVDLRTPCSVPASAQSFVVNATVVPTASLIYLTLWAHGSAQPLQSTLNAYDSAVTSNLAVVPTSDGLVSSFSAAPTGLIFDMFGYFAP